MTKYFLTLLIIGFSLGSISGVEIINSGDWDNPNTWSNLNIGDDISEDVTITSNKGTIVVRTGFSYTIGDLTMNNSNLLTIKNGSTLNLGNASTPKTLYAKNTAQINIEGTLVIWGDLNVKNNLNLNIIGSLTVKGDLIMNNNSNLTVEGNLNVENNFIGGNNIISVVNGSINVGVNIEVGNGSNASGAGIITYGGICTDDDDSYCNWSTLPVSIILFKATKKDIGVEISWTTATEINNDFFIIEKSSDGQAWFPIEKIEGNGNSYQMQNYSCTDEQFTKTAYYRLIQVDYNGTREYYNPIAVEGGVENWHLNLFPNPARNLLIIEHNESSTLKFFHANGIEINHLSISNLSEHTSVVDIRLLPAGLYFVTTSQKTKKFLVKK